MKKIFLLTIFFVFVGKTFSQKEFFDLISYVSPKDVTGSSWEKDVAENTTSYTIVNKKNNSWCRITIVKSTVSKGDISQDFESEWQDLVVKNYKPADNPQLNEVQEADGWKIKTGGSKFIFNNSDVMALLTTATGFNRCVSIVATTNSQDYLKDIEALLASVDLIKPEVNSQQITNNNSDNTSIIGTWGVSRVTAYRSGTEGTAGSTVTQYTFNANGTYSFYIKTFRYSYNKLLLTRETGTYKISGAALTVNPQKCVIEAWSKKDGTSNWGKLLSSQNKTLEKTTYQFTKHYFSGVQEWNLVLQANNETQRDGHYSNSTTFSKAWLYSPVTCKECFIKLPD